MKKNIRFNILSLVLFGIMHFGFNVYAQEVVAPPVFADVQKNLSEHDGKWIKGDFIGAELFANYDSQDSTTIYLKRYFNCKAQSFPDKEVVIIYEKELGMIFKSLSLIIADKTVLDDGMNAACSAYAEINNCMTMITYSAKTDLMIMPSGYNVVWKHGALSEMQFGLDPEEISGLALSIHIPDIYQAGSNQLKGLKPITQYNFCGGRSYTLNLKGEEQTGANSTFAIYAPNSYHPADTDEQDNFMAASNMMGEDLVSDIPEKILLKGPPFRPVSRSIATDFEVVDGNNTFAQLDKNSGILNFKPPATGKYLIGISKINTKNTKPQNYHQAVFLFQAN